MSEKNIDLNRWLSIGEAARRLGIHPATLRRWADSGQIAYATTPGGHRRFSTDVLARLGDERRLITGAAEVEHTWAETALTVTRRTLAEHSGESWLSRNEGWREQHRKLGRQLMGLTMQFISASDEDAEHFLSEARRVGKRYAEITRQAGLPLTESLSAAVFFRDMLTETVLQLPETIRIRPESSLHLIRRINALLNTVHLTIAKEYDAGIDNI